MFVDRVVDNFPNAVVERCSIVWIAEIHTGAFSDRL
jgi:hypothetical protein